jgi:hypothetical protein
MRKRRLFVVLGIGLLVTCFGVALAIKLSKLSANGHPILRAFGRIRLGMTQSEVETAIGMPPGDYDTKNFFKSLTSGPFGEYVSQSGLPDSSLPDANNRPSPGYSGKLTVHRWIWEDYWIWVAFDERDMVVGYYLLEAMDANYPRHPPGILDRVKAWWRGKWRS